MAVRVLDNGARVTRHAAARRKAEQMTDTRDRQLKLFLATEQCLVGVSPQAPVTLRRSENPRTFFLADPSVSSRSDGVATLQVVHDRLEIVPADASTAILLNGSRVHGPTELRQGDRLRIGFTTLVLNSLHTAGDDAAEAVKTVLLASEFVRRREPLEAAADRLAWWSQSFEAMLQADDASAVAAVVLRQIADSFGTTRGVFAAGVPARELASEGLTAAESERVLSWIQRHAADEDEVRTPTLEEVLGTAEAARAIVVRKGDGDEAWWLFCDSPGNGAELEVAYRIRSVLASMLTLHRNLHAQRSQDRRLAELTQTVRVYAQPAEQQLYETVRSHFIHSSDTMRRVCRDLTRAALAPSPVLLLGEPGTGKQLAAEARARSEPSTAPRNGLRQPGGDPGNTDGEPVVRPRGQDLFGCAGT